jgi:hypothetical protein
MEEGYKMKYYIKAILIFILIFSVLVGCGQKSQEETEDFQEIVMVNKKLWYSTQIEVNIEPDENEILGAITSSIEEGQIPEVDDQSNFGEVGSQYARFDESLLVNLSGKWVLFIDENDWKENNGNISVKGSIIIAYPESKKEEIFGDASDKEISIMLDKISKELEKGNLEDKDIIIERVFKESGLSDPLLIESAKSNLTISKL